MKKKPTRPPDERRQCSDPGCRRLVYLQWTHLVTSIPGFPMYIVDHTEVRNGARIVRIPGTAMHRWRCDTHLNGQ